MLLLFLAGGVGIVLRDDVLVAIALRGSATHNPGAYEALVGEHDAPPLDLEQCDRRPETHEATARLTDLEHIADGEGAARVKARGELPEERRPSQAKGPNHADERAGQRDQRHALDQVDVDPELLRRDHCGQPDDHEVHRYGDQTQQLVTLDATRTAVSISHPLTNITKYTRFVYGTHLDYISCFLDEKQQK